MNLGIINYTEESSSCPEVCGDIVQRAGESRAGGGTWRGRRGGMATAAPPGAQTGLGGRAEARKQKEVTV